MVDGSSKQVDCSRSSMVTLASPCATDCSTFGCRTVVNGSSVHVQMGKIICAQGTSIASCFTSLCRTIMNRSTCLKIYRATTIIGVIFHTDSPSIIIRSGIVHYGVDGIGRKTILQDYTIFQIERTTHKYINHRPTSIAKGCGSCSTSVIHLRISPVRSAIDDNIRKRNLYRVFRQIGSTACPVSIASNGNKRLEMVSSLSIGSNTFNRVLVTSLTL